jgi:hypothetical protein
MTSEAKSPRKARKGIIKFLGGADAGQVRAMHQDYLVASAAPIRFFRGGDAVEGSGEGRRQSAWRKLSWRGGLKGATPLTSNRRTAAL